jgi:hypothetical protein
MKVIGPKTIERRRGTIPGSVGRFWGLSGVTRVDSSMLKASIEIESDGTHAQLINMTIDHEMGHVSVACDVRDFYGQDAFDDLLEYDRWQHEVEAWIRGLSDTMIWSDEQGRYVLDCLNSYRRALDVSDRDWVDGVRALLFSLVTDESIRNYLLGYRPLEPDPDDDPGTGGCITRGDVEDGGGEPEPERAPETDRGWLRRDIMKQAFNDPNSIPALAAEHGLDLNKLPPLLKAVITS